jgi:hypothetical protein
MDKEPINGRATWPVSELEEEMAREYSISFGGSVIVGPTFVPISIGRQFVYRSKELLGEDYHGRIPSFEGQALTVVGFRPQYVNSVVVADEAGRDFLLRPQLVERALRLGLGQD